MRRFGRRRRTSGGDGRAAPIDAKRWLDRIVEEKIVPAKSLEPISGATAEAVPSTFAAVGIGEAEDGSPLIVSFAPEFGGDAALAGLVAARTSADGTESDFQGEVVAVSPQWTTAARRTLGLVGDLPFRFRAVGASTLGEGGATVEADLAAEEPILGAEGVAAHLTIPAQRDLFLRAAAVLDGLASKHGGAVRGIGRSLELVILARRVAELRAEDGGVELNTILPQRSTARLTGDDLAAVLDGLEGNLRRRLNDRKARDGEEGTRARVAPLIVRAQELRSVARWPLGGLDQDAIDLVGVDGKGQPVVAASREHLTLASLRTVLDAVLRVRPALPLLLEGAEAPLRLDSIRLVLAVRDCAPGVPALFPLLSLAHDLYQIRPDRDRGLELMPLASGEAPVRVRSPRPSEGGRGRGRGRAAPQSREAEAEVDTESESADSGSAEARRRPPRRRGRRKGVRGGEGADREGSAATESGSEDSEGAVEEPSAKRRSPRFEEVSLFDLDDGNRGGDSEDRAGSSRRRRRSRRGSRRGPGTGENGSERAETPGEEAPTSAGDREPGPRSRRRRPARVKDEEDEVFEDEEGVQVDAGLAALPDDDVPLVVPDPSSYDDDEEEDGDEDTTPTQRREGRRKPRAAAPTEAPAEAEPPKAVRRRAVIVAHADPDSVLSAILLARDIRLLEGIWVYPQEELMTFFRSVTTDLREDTPIYVVGFAASPARDVIQAASLYADRLIWFDSHDWPPEDLDSLRRTIGAESVHVSPGAGSVLPSVLQTCTRRSRFSDKLVDLATGRFTQHDYERWGRLWWWRISELGAKSGECKADVDPLLAGRPSDLAKEAARVELPPIPPELAFVSERDFRLVHFAGYTLVVVEVDPGLQLHMCARLARERYQAPLSLAYARGEETLVFSGDELGGRRSTDYAGLVEHLATKNGWVDSLPDADHVARMRIRDLQAHPERLDEVIGQIAMGRSVLER